MKYYNGWISVDDKLPDTFTDVLVVQKYQPTPMVAYITRDGKDWVENCQNAVVYGNASFSTEICKVEGELDYLKITHWMPLPELPRERE